PFAAFACTASHAASRCGCAGAPCPSVLTCAVGMNNARPAAMLSPSILFIVVLPCFSYPVNRNQRTLERKGRNACKRLGLVAVERARRHFSILPPAAGQKAAGALDDEEPRRARRRARPVDGDVGLAV